MNTKHTPGPWKADEDYINSITIRHDPANPHATGVEVASVYDDDAISDEMRANARLIAAAPALYEALKAVVAVADRKTVEFDAARAALALAEGRS